MHEINLNFEVHAYRPKWAVKHPHPIYSDSRYRIYINNDLITERNWIWDNNILLLENIWLRSTELHYTLKLDPILMKNPAQAVFSIKNLNVINSQADINKIDDLQVNFTLR
jgi:hypothetical protein